jgi:hypothetical protein
MPTEQELNRLNMNVTSAIFAAERADYDASVAWFTVRDAEAAILAALPDLPENELQREIARRGVDSARARAMLLRSKKDEDAEKPESCCPVNCNCPGCYALKREVNRLELRINELLRAVGLDRTENETWPKIIEWVTSAGRLSSVMVVKAKTLDGAADDVMRLEAGLDVREHAVARFRRQAWELREKSALVADRGESFGNYLVETNLGYQRAVATLTAERDHLRALLVEALDLWGDSIPYMGPYFDEKYGYTERLTEIRKLIDAPQRHANENCKNCRDAERAQEKAEENLLAQDRYVRDLRAALRPFAETAEILGDYYAPNQIVLLWGSLTANMFHAAHAAYGNDPQAEASGRAIVPGNMQSKLRTMLAGIDEALAELRKLTEAAP